MGSASQDSTQVQYRTPTVEEVVVCEWVSIVEVVGVAEVGEAEEVVGVVVVWISASMFLRAPFSWEPACRGLHHQTKECWEEQQEGVGEK